MAVRNYKSRFYMSDKDNSIGDEVSSLISKASLRVDMDADIPMTLDIEFGARGDVALMDVDVPNWSYLSVYMENEVWKPSTGSTTDTSQVGLFIMLPATEVHTSSGHYHRMTGHDLSWLLAQDVFYNGFSVGRGRTIMDQVGDLLAARGIWHVLEPSTKQFASARSWDVNSEVKTVLNEMLAIAGYYKLMPNRRGKLVSYKYRQLDKMDPRRTIRSADGFVSNAVQIESDPDQMWNMVTVVKNMGSEDMIKTRAINNRADSPVSTVNLGFTKAHVVQDSNIADLAAAKIMAKKLLEEGATYIERIEIQTPPDLHFEPREVIALDIVNDYGIQIADGKYWWDQIDINLKPDGPMTWRFNKLQPWEVDPE